MSSTIQITGTAMAVLIGAVMIIAPWSIEISFGYKLLVSVIGGLFVWLGISFSS